MTSTHRVSTKGLAELRENHPTLKQCIGETQAMRSVLLDVVSVARASCPVLLEGESGTGKELVARMIHEISHDGEGPLEAVNCGGIPESLLESELFGHVPGAFTGAVRNHRGVFERAADGTVFLDEIAEMSSPAQVKLLRVLQEGTFTPVGGEKQRRSGARIMAATNRDLRTEVRQGRFRRDLFYRLNVYPIRLPSLRKRREDIPRLIDHFLDRHSKEMRRPRPRIHPTALRRLLIYTFPGNVRELQNIVSALLIEAHGSSEILDRHVVAVFSRYQVEDSMSLPDSSTETDVVDAADARNPGRWVLEQLRTYGYNIALAERMLTLRRRECEDPRSIRVCSRSGLTYYFQGEGLRALREEQWSLDAAALRLSGHRELTSRVRTKLRRVMESGLRALRGGGPTPTTRLISLRKTFVKLPEPYLQDLMSLSAEFEKGRWPKSDG